MMDYDLAKLYGVATKRLKEQVTRNRERFPEDFMFRLDKQEVDAFNRSHFATGSQRHRDPRYPPRAFTEQGVAMLSTVLKSSRAVEVNIGIMRTFVRLRHLLASNQQLAQKVNEHDRKIATLFHHVEKLLEPPPAPKKNQIGFKSNKQRDDSTEGQTR